MPIHRHLSLGDQERLDLPSRQPDTLPRGLFYTRYLLHGADSVHMPEDEVAPQGTPEAQRPLEVDGMAGLEPAERRPRERLGPELEDTLAPPALDHRRARAVHGDARADVAALERHARLHAEPERGAGARQRDDGPHFLDDPGEHLFDVGGSGVAPPDHPPPAPHDGRIHPSIAPASPALESRFV